MTFQDMMAAVQAVILFLGLGATVYTLRFNRKDSMRRSTLDLIIHQRSDEDLNKAMSKVNDLISEKGVYEDLSSYFQNRHSEEAQAILKVLNFREFVAVGINLRVIDEDIPVLKLARKTPISDLVSQFGNPLSHKIFDCVDDYEAYLLNEMINAYS